MCIKCQDEIFNESFMEVIYKYFTVNVIKIYS